MIFTNSSLLNWKIRIDRAERRRAGYPEAADVERYARRGDGGRNQDQRSGIDSEYGDFR